MLTILQTIIHRFIQRPVRTLLVLLSVAFGSAIIALAGSIQTSLDKALDAVDGQGGTVLAITNGTEKADGTVSMTFPPEFDGDDAAKLSADLNFVDSITPVSTLPNQILTVGGERYRVRTGIGTGAEYADMFGLTMIAGSFFSTDDVSSKKQVAVISESTAEALFGDAEAAVGQSVEQTAGDFAIVVRRENGQNSVSRISSRSFSIVGVYQDVEDFKRRAWGIGDFVIPYTTQFPSGMPMASFVRTFMAQVSGIQADEAEPKIAAALREIHGEDTSVSVWEGGPDGAGAVLQDTRDVVERVSGLMSGLGYLILLISLFGIFSTMLVEVIDRRREIGIRRALGANLGRTVMEIGLQSAMLTGIGALFGLLITFVLGAPIMSGLGAFLESAGVPAQATNVDLAPASLLLTFAVATGAGFAFGLIPGAQAARNSIIESLRD